MEGKTDQPPHIISILNKIAVPLLPPDCSPLSPHISALNTPLVARVIWRIRIPNAPVIRPIVKGLLRRAHRDVHHAGRAQPVLDDGVDRITVGHIDGGPAIFVAVSYVGFDDAMNGEVSDGGRGGREGEGGVPSDKIIANDAAPVVAVKGVEAG